MVVSRDFPEFLTRLEAHICTLSNANSYIDPFSLQTCVDGACAMAQALLWVASIATRLPASSGPSFVLSPGYLLAWPRPARSQRLCCRILFHIPHSECSAALPFGSYRSMLIMFVSPSFCLTILPFSRPCMVRWSLFPARSRPSSNAPSKGATFASELLGGGEADISTRSCADCNSCVNGWLEGRRWRFFLQ